MISSLINAGSRIEASQRHRLVGRWLCSAARSAPRQLQVPQPDVSDHRWESLHGLRSRSAAMLLLSCRLLSPLALRIAFLLDDEPSVQMRRANLRETERDGKAAAWPSDSSPSTQNEPMATTGCSFERTFLRAGRWGVARLKSWWSKDEQPQVRTSSDHREVR